MESETLLRKHVYAIQLDLAISEVGSALDAMGGSDQRFTVADDRARRSIDALEKVTYDPQQVRGIDEMREALDLIGDCHRGQNVLSETAFKKCLASFREANDQAWADLGVNDALRGLSEPNSRPHSQ